MSRNYFLKVNSFWERILIRCVIQPEEKCPMFRRQEWPICGLWVYTEFLLACELLCVHINALDVSVSRNNWHAWMVKTDTYYITSSCIAS